MICMRGLSIVHHLLIGIALAVHSIRRRVHSTRLLSIDNNSQRGYQFTYDPPAFFPLSLEDLVADSSFALQSALISRLHRLRIDIDIRLCHRERVFLEWLLLMSYKLLNEEFTCIHIFIDEYYKQKLNLLWEEKLLQLYSQGTDKNLPLLEKERQRIRISSLSDSHLTKEDKLIMLFNPNNIVEYEGSTVNVLEEVEAICFHGESFLSFIYFVTRTPHRSFT